MNFIEFEVLLYSVVFLEFRCMVLAYISYFNGCIFGNQPS